MAVGKSIRQHVAAATIAPFCSCFLDGPHRDAVTGKKSNTYAQETVAIHLISFWVDFISSFLSLGCAFV